ncbi:MAG: Asp-tRNA(Asn)/Glu-tRNA(Gln) amidotransferase subunit GatA [bacterium]|nr:Asp-tRNA(Asn)/Glu-tRNA(Gln) amidotransferase subunit GatA [bacterium]
MRISETLIRHLEGIARLETSREERRGLRCDLGRFLEYAADLPDVDPAQAIGTAIPTHLSGDRPDEISPSLSQTEALAAAPTVRAGHFLVPPVLPAAADSSPPPLAVAPPVANPSIPVTSSVGESALTALSLTEALQGLEKGEFSAAEYRRDLRARIQQINPVLNAYCYLEPSDEAETPSRSGTLRGLPFALKDNLHRLGEPLQCASRILTGYRAPYDATVTAKLLAAGGSGLGRTNMDEFGMGSSCEYSIHGSTRNPWSPAHSPGGSSGGAAAAVAADCALFALGSDTGGSLRQPAAHCGVVGIKPTYGRVSRYGLVAFASSLDQVGPITRDVRDAAQVLELIMGADPRDATCRDLPTPGLMSEVDNGVRGLRIGVPSGLGRMAVSSSIRKSLNDAREALVAEGARIVPVDLPELEQGVAAYYLLANAEASSNLARFDGVRYGARAADCADLATLYSRTRGEGFGPEVKRRILLGAFTLSSGYYAAYYLRAQQVRRRLTDAFDRLWRRCECLLLPVTPGPAFPLQSRLADPLSMYLEDLFTVPASLAGLPAGSVPLGLCDGLPLGGQVVAPPFAEATLIRTLAALERAFPMRATRGAAVAAALADGGGEP